MRRALVVLPLLVAMASGGCGGGSSAGSATPRPSATRSSSPVLVSSSVPDGAVLSAAVPWTATVSASAQDVVESVEFWVDGTKRWTEKNEPYSFDDDGQVLAPWLLGAGSHRLVVKAYTSEGMGEKALSVTVRAQPPATAVAGTYRRAVSAADASRTAGYRTEELGAFGEALPLGRWTMTVSRDGLITLVDPVDASIPSFEPFTLAGSRLHLYGAANYVRPGSQPSLFCDPERGSDYTWSVRNGTLTLQPVQKVCADRDLIVVGSWSRV